MPRKTRNNAKTEQAVMLDDPSMKVENKKETFLADFDARVSQEIKLMEKYLKKVVGQMTLDFNAQKSMIDKDVRSMKLNDFLKNGGDINILDLTDAVKPLMETEFPGDISFQAGHSGEPEDKFKAPMPPVRRSSRKRAVQDASPLVNDAPLIKSKGRGRSVTRSAAKPKLVGKTAPPINPKFDYRKPLNLAREPKLGETLVSLNGSPVVRKTSESDSTNLCDIVLNNQHTILGGTFFDASMSPSFFAQNRDRLVEVMEALKTRFEEVNLSAAQRSNLNNT